MIDNIKRISEITAEFAQIVGTEAYFLGKAKELQIPILDGYVATNNDVETIDDLFEVVNNFVITMKSEETKANKVFNVSVRPSISFKDNQNSFFAGKIQNIHDLTNVDDVVDTVLAMIDSGNNELIERYCLKHEIPFPLPISAIIQEKVAGELSGKIYTAMPETGAHTEMQGYFINGSVENLETSEDYKLFSLSRPDGLYKGPAILQGYSKKIYEYALKLHDVLNIPLEIEWVIYDNKLRLTRITHFGVLNPYRLDTYDINESVDGDFLWSNFSLMEYLPDVLTPMTWSMLRKLDTTCEDFPKYYKWSGNICGRAYSNINVPYSVNHYIEPISINNREVSLDKDVYGNIPMNIDIPIYPFKRIFLVQHLTKKRYTLLSHGLNKKSKAEYFIENTNGWRHEMLRQLNEANLDVWEDLWEQINNYLAEIWVIWHEYSDDRAVSQFRRKLTSIIGEEEANNLISDYSGEYNLESLGPILGIEKLYNQEITRKEFKESYGHRSPHELELSMPYPYEDNDFITKQLIELESADVGVIELLERQHKVYKQRLQNFCDIYPKHKYWLLRNLCKIKGISQEKDAIYSELIRVFSVTRMALVKLGELMGIYSDVFYLYDWEIYPLIHGQDYIVDNIGKRKRTCEEYRNMEKMPHIIRGEYDYKNPVDIMLQNNKTYFEEDEKNLVKSVRATRMANNIANINGEENQDDKTETDMSDTGEIPTLQSGKNNNIKQLQITGIGGVSEIVEGTVRVINDFEELIMLKPGEILVTSAINAGWSYQFPKMKAIITDVGTNFSSGAVIARELGIPTIVGCLSATKQLKTGDRVIVDGGKGYITKIDSKVEQSTFNIDEISQYLA